MNYSLTFLYYLYNTKTTSSLTCWYNKCSHSSVVEQQTVNLLVVGSNPSGSAIEYLSGRSKSMDFLVVGNHLRITVNRSEEKRWWYRFIAYVHIIINPRPWDSIEDCISKARWVNILYGPMVEMEYTLHLKCNDHAIVRVRVPFGLL